MVSILNEGVYAKLLDPSSYSKESLITSRCLRYEEKRIKKQKGQSLLQKILKMLQEVVNERSRREGGGREIQDDSE